MRHKRGMIKHLIDSAPAGPEPPAESGARILLVEDNAGDARLTQESLATQKVDKFTMVHVASLAAACLRLREGHFDAVLLDLSLPDAHGPDTLSSLRQQAPSIPIVVLTGLSDEATAIQAVKEGAQDYLVKGETDGNTLARRLRFAIERHLSSSARAVQADQPKVVQDAGLPWQQGRRRNLDHRLLPGDRAARPDQGTGSAGRPRLRMWRLGFPHGSGNEVLSDGRPAERGPPGGGHLELSGMQEDPRPRYHHGSQRREPAEKRPPQSSTGKSSLSSAAHTVGSLPIWAAASTGAPRICWTAAM